MLVQIAVALPLLAGLAFPQGQIRDANATYRIGAIAPNQADSVDCDFSADPAIGDVLVEQWWHYRVHGDTDETALRDDGNLSQRYSGRHADLNWPDVDGRGLFRAHLGYDVFSTGPVSARVYSRLTVFNLTRQPLRISLYHYSDVGPCGTGPESAFGDRYAHGVSAACSGSVVAVEHHFPDRYQIEDRDDGECGILDPGPALLSQSGLPFASGDCTGAAQWDLVIPVGEQFTVWTSIWHNPGGCPSPQVENYGFGRPGTRGIPRITSTLPVMGQVATVTVSNALPNTPAVLVFGFGRVEIPIGPLTLQVLAGPRGIDFDSFVITTDGSGGQNLRIALPASDEYCARPVNWQCFFLDGGAPGGFPFSQTDGLEWVMGR
jgi:hypothetical protein